MKIDNKPIIRLAKDHIKKRIPLSARGLGRTVNHTADYCIKVLHKEGLWNAFSNIPVSTEVCIERDQRGAVLRQLRAENKQLYSRIQSLNRDIAVSQSLEGVSKYILAHKINIRQSHNREATAFAMASDWHSDEIIRGSEIDGLNQHNPKIGRERTDRFFERVLKLLTMCRKESKIDTLVITALGDFISGWIHEDLITDTTPPEALLMVFEQWVSGLDFLLEHAGLKEIIVVCCVGNHARITKRTQHKKRSQKNYEWLLYQFLAKWYGIRKVKGIKFQLPTGYFNYLTVYGNKIRCHHGDNVRFQGGVGGIHIPLNKAISQWNKAKHADLDLLGHWHSRKIERGYVINGSVVGYSEYAQSIKADFEPPAQCFFIMHPKYGKTAEFSIVLN